VSAPEPSIADVLEAIRGVRVSMLEMRADWADRWARSNERLDEISRRLGTLTDSLADSRAEYNEHHHPHTHGEEAA
jgi:hypothetical protein